MARTVRVPFRLAGSVAETEEAPSASITLRGEGRPTVLLHSSGLGARQWAGLAHAWRASRETWSLDLPGYGTSAGSSDGPEEALRLDLAAAEATLVLAAATGTADLAGHSYGGFLALHVARRRPELVGRLLLHEPVAWGCLLSDGTDDEIAAYGAVVETLQRGESPGSEPWLRSFIGFWNGEGAWERLPQRRRTGLAAVGAKCASEVLAVCQDAEPSAAWSELNVPTLVTVGRATNPLEAAVCRYLVAAMPEASLKTIEGGHLAPVTHLPELAAVWGTFLELGAP